jgi:hypothetical protein
MRAIHCAAARAQELLSPSISLNVDAALAQAHCAANWTSEPGWFGDLLTAEESHFAASREMAAQDLQEAFERQSLHCMNGTCCT